MTLPVFPTLPIGWSKHRKPKSSSRRQSHVNGREVVVALQAIPRFAFELTSEAMSSGAARGAIAANTKQLLEAFFTDLLGPAGTFLYADPDDNAVTGFTLGIYTTSPSFTFLWPWGVNPVPVGQVNNAAINIYANGALVDPSQYNVTLPNTLTFTTPPAANAVITGDYGYYFVCRFDDDELDFEEFMSQLWSIDGIKFTSVKP